MVSSLPAAAALLLLAAHFYRAGPAWLVPACALLAALVFAPRRWAALVGQVALLLGTLEWVRTLVSFAGARVAQGRPVLRLVLIIGAVIAFTLWSAWLLRPRVARRADRSAG